MLVQHDGALTGTERLIIANLSIYAGLHAFAWPSTETLAAKLCFSVPHIKRSLRRGRERGWLIHCGKRGFGGSVNYAMGIDPTVAGEIENRLEGLRISQQIRRDHPELKRRAPLNRITRDTNAHSDHPRYVEGITGDTNEGSPAIRNPIQGTYPLNLEEGASEEVVVLGRDESPKPRAIPLSARATGGQNCKPYRGMPTREPPTADELRESMARLSRTMKRRSNA
jgi:hypothetical protein